ITVDYDQRELTLTKDSAQTRGVVVPIGHSGIPTVSAELDGVTGHFGLDLGARSALLLYTPFVEKNGLREKYRAAFDTITGWGIGGPVRSQVARAKVLKIGGVEVHDPVIRLSTQKAGLTTSSHLDGLIGPDVFRQFRTTFDYRNDRVIFAKGPQFGKRDTYDRLGAWMGQNGDNFKILDVAPGSPAEKAGLQKGDLVLEIDGKRTSSLLLPDARERMRTLPVGTAVQFKVHRGQEKMEITAKLRDLV
ncbi:MAG TPA: PDZ domain-containing protein, partial [Terriglobales bacterium]